MRLSINDIRSKRQKALAETLATEMWYSVYFIRRFSLYGTWLAISLGMSANAVTIASYVLGYVAAGLFAVGEPVYVYAGVITLHIAFIVDNVDGEVARCTGTQSLTGAYLDTLGHILINSAVNFGLGIGLFFATGWTWTLFAGFIAGYFNVPVSRYSMDHEILKKIRKGENSSGSGSADADLKRDESREDALQEKLKRYVVNLGQYGFPFTGSPYNILAITVAVSMDAVLGAWQIGPMEFNAVALLLAFYAAVLLLQQASSLMRQVVGMKVDLDLRRIMTEVLQRRRDHV